ncbi:MAG: hypothetical protein HWE27_09425 [Gammaproteobacteria bacterium]|nr:hypothetical protein [Gammaproteobacteria bacterium]
MKAVVAVVFLLGLSLMVGMWSFLFKDPHNQAMAGLVLVLISLVLVRRKVER